ncbi:hypothetical protein SteCoe_25233 [Stentor coeruleus]|uniref:Uncharacterized protein n=1 Tax=Stentor coeruleus TaxID=5963 RepID=A0A1R2BFQ8_9CILI|nr:hypothetical protein SteCoe_25233 [Stentor coeruleus]
MSNMISIWTGEEDETPKIIQKNPGELLSFNDTCSFIMNGQILAKVSYIPKPQTLKIPICVICCACNSQTSLFVTAEGDVWGSSKEETSRMILGKMVKKDKLVKIEGLSNIIRVSLGNTHAAAINSKGKLFIWGEGEDHQLGEVKTKKQGPTLVKKAEIFTAEQVLCGEKSTLIRTEGGYVYIFGLLGHYEYCKKPCKPKALPYTLNYFEPYFITDMRIGKSFVAVLSLGDIHVFDSCLKPVRLTIYNNDIISIASTEFSLFGLEKNYLYQWIEYKGHKSCGIRNWIVKVYMLEKGYLDCTLISGYGKNIGFMCDDAKGFVGKVIKNNKFLDDAGDANFEEGEVLIRNLKLGNGHMDDNWKGDSKKRAGVVRLTDAINKELRLSFIRLIGKISYKNWVLGENNANSSIDPILFVNKLELILKKKLKLHFSAFQNIFSTKKGKFLAALTKNLTKYLDFTTFSIWKKNCKAKSPYHKSPLRFGILLLNSANSKLLRKIKSSVFILLIRYKPDRLRNKVVLKHLQRIVKAKLGVFFTCIFMYIDGLKVNLLKSILLIKVKKEEKNKCIQLIKCFSTFKNSSSSSASCESRKSSEFSNNNSFRKPKLNLKMISEGDSSVVYYDSSPILEKNLSADQSTKTIKTLNKSREGLFSKTAQKSIF